MASPHEKKEFESWYRALITVVAPSADRRDLPHAGIQVKRGKPEIPASFCRVSRNFAAIICNTTNAEQSP
jgi:hypothetical protein